MKFKPTPIRATVKLLFIGIFTMSFVASATAQTGKALYARSKHFR